MIKGLRIDERLIHGQVAVAWSTVLGVDGILVANDKAANSEIETMSLKMAAPSTMKVSVQTIEGAIKLLNNPRIGKRTLLVIVGNPSDALALIKNAPGLPFVNVGNCGMINPSGKNIIGTSFAVDDDDLKIFKEIIELRPESNYQMTPTLPAQKLSELLI